MCFYNDPDWHASLIETTDKVADHELKCFECHRKIAAGETYQYVYMQEHEYCHRRDDGECECEADECCQCPEPDMGETYNQVTCQECFKFLNAVEAAEIEAGCHWSEARPSLGGMFEEIPNGGAREAKKYGNYILGSPVITPCRTER